MSLLKGSGGPTGRSFGGNLQAAGLSLGTAVARIMIDTSDTNDAANRVASSLQRIESSLGATSNRMQHNMGALNTQFGGLTRSILGAGVALMGLRSGIGIIQNLASETAQMADNLRLAQVSFEAYLGSATKATQMMQRLRQYAREAGIPQSQAIFGGQRLMPGMTAAGMDTGRVTQGLDLARRLALVNPNPQTGGGFEGAVLAITEMMQGQFRSLNQRFANLGDAIKDASKKFGGDQFMGLSAVLDEMGITSEKAKESTDTLAMAFARLHDNLILLLAQSLLPATKGLKDLINDLAILTAKIETLNTPFTRFVLTMGAFVVAALALQAVLTSLPAMFAAVTAAMQAMLASGQAQAALYGGVAFGAALGAREALRASGRATGDERLSNITFEEMVKTAGKAISDMVMITVVASTKGWATIAAGAETAFASIKMFIGEVVMLLGAEMQQLGNIPGFENLKTVGNTMQAVGSTIVDLSVKQTDFWANLDKNLAIANDHLAVFYNTLFPKELAADYLERHQGELNTGRRRMDEEFTDDQIAMWDEYNANRKAIEQQLAKDLLTEYTAYSTELKKRTAEFNKDRLREQEDFERDWDNRETELNRRISELKDEGAAQQKKAETQFNLRIAEMQQAAYDDEQQRLADHQLKMQRMAEDHRDALAEAASRLDVLAFIREIQSYNKKKRREEEDFAREQAQRKIEFDKKLALEIAHYQESYAEQADANKEKIAQMRAQFEFEHQQAEAEFAIKRQRELDDFNATIAALKIEHDAKLQAIIDGAKAEKDLLEAKFKEQFIATQTHLDAVNTLMEQKRAESLAGLRAWWDEIVKMVGVGPYPPGSDNNTWTPYATGGTLLRSGGIRAHAGETIFSAANSRMLSQLAGSGNIQQNTLAALAKRERPDMPINIEINGVHDAAEAIEQLKLIAKTELIEAIDRYNNGSD